MGTPSIFSQYSGPISFVLFREKCLKLCSKALPFARSDLGFKHVYICVNNPLESGGNGSCKCIELEVVIGVFPLERFRNLSTDLNIEVSNKFTRTKSPRIALVTIYLFGLITQMRSVKPIGCREINADCGSIFPSNW